jgi:hypothetical protein
MHRLQSNATGLEPSGSRPRLRFCRPQGVGMRRKALVGLCPLSGALLMRILGPHDSFI